MTADVPPAPAGLRMDRLAAAMVRTIREPLLVLDEELVVLTANPAFYDTFSVGPHGTIGQRLPELGNHQWDIPELRRQLDGILGGGAPVDDYEVEHEFEDIGHRIMRISARRITREGDDLILVAINDVTELEESRREREELVAALEESNRDLERFAYIASHDLQEPLRMISSFTELLADRYAGQLDEKADRYIEYAVDGARRMQAMITGLLEYSRAGRVEEPPGPVALDDVLATARRDLSVILEETCAELAVESLPVVSGHRARLEQVFRNLLSNALKFRGEGAPRIRVTAGREDGMWRIGVHDNGIGIEPEYLGQIFVIFKRLNSRREYDGAGLGLALCRRIVEHRGGRVEVESEPGVGSTFWVILPTLEDA